MFSDKIWLDEDAGIVLPLTPQHWDYRRSWHAGVWTQFILFCAAAPKPSLQTMELYFNF